MASALCEVKTCRYKHIRKDKCTCFHMVVKEIDGKPICVTYKPIEKDELERRKKKNALYIKST
jgi:hypothetical protein